MTELYLRKPRRRPIRTQDELRAAVVDVTALATRVLSIFTQDLEPAVYDHDDFIESIKCFVLSRSFARVRVLINDPNRAIRGGHRFVTIGRRLSSYVEFRNVREELREGNEAYLIADDIALLHRPDASRWEGVCELHSPLVAKPQLDRFEQLWQTCELRLDTRVLHV